MHLLVLLRQLFDPESSTFTYLVADTEHRVAALIDPVLGQVERDVKLLSELGLELAFVLENQAASTYAFGLLAASGKDAIAGMATILPIEAEHAAKLPGAKIPEFRAGDTVVVNVKVAEGDRTRDGRTWDLDHSAPELRVTVRPRGESDAIAFQRFEGGTTRRDARPSPPLWASTPAPSSMGFADGGGLGHG